MVAFGLALGLPAAGCAAPSDNAEASASELSTELHTPKGEERTGIVAAYKAKLSVDLHGQTVFLNAADPAGRFLAHGDWAYFEGIIEGPNDNRTPIDFANSEFANEAKQGFLEGVQRNGNFAAKFQSVAHRDANGSWAIAAVKPAEKAVAYAVGPSYEAWRSWASLPAPGLRDIFVAFPVDDLHEPQAQERDAIIGSLRAQISQDVHGQTIDFNVTDPKGTFLSHDGWAYISGIIVGANDNAIAVDYRNSVYSAAGSSFKGVLHNNNFAAIVRAIFKKEADGTWHLSTSNNGEVKSPGYAVGKQTWVGDPSSDFAWDIFGYGKGDGDGDGDGDGG